MQTTDIPHPETAPAKAFATVRQLATMQSVPFSTGAIRMQIARAEKNGLAPHIRRIGRRVLIDVNGYFTWMDGGDA
ncbi:hypothetical protein LV476_01990 [Guyparkeria hydrothermalis]|uniref:hypothetical protein n=1 Tax=Guyparkeria hydrothermalis TaxID=923 RepID=UPI002021CFC4|nr:hypothetical protein [Guyparkeria hydrothermalis]MCL7743723.1 hypothetical protein [Guyparkeria hydrothermalis]